MACLAGAAMTLHPATAHATAETPQDLPWADAVRSWEKNPTQTLAQVLPELASRLKQDAAIPELKSLWGESLNYDESVKTEIIHGYILDDLERGFGTFRSPAPVDPNQRRVAHAGLQHTYGYLLNNLDTSFGFKRARWVSTEIERGFGLGAPLLGPPSLLANITLVVGRIGFSGSPARLKQLEALAPRAEARLRKFPARPLPGKRLRETIDLEGGRRVELITDLIPFPAPVPGAKNSALLVYSISDSAVDGGLPRLVTAFPVEAGFVEQAVNPAKLGPDQPIVTRYNAFVPGVSGVSGTTFKGNRTVTSHVFRN
jgi:hypothetical protein